MFYTLPDELLSHILDYCLNSVETLLCLEQVNSKLNHFLNIIFWKRCLFTVYPIHANTLPQDQIMFVQQIKYHLRHCHQFALDYLPVNDEYLVHFNFYETDEPIDERQQVQVSVILIGAAQCGKKSLSELLRYSHVTCRNYKFHEHVSPSVIELADIWIQVYDITLPFAQQFVQFEMWRQNVEEIRTVPLPTLAVINKLDRYMEYQISKSNLALLPLHIKISTLFKYNLQELAQRLKEIYVPRPEDEEASAETPPTSKKSCILS